MAKRLADWIRMPFGAVSGVGRGMGELEGVHVPQGEKGFRVVLDPIAFNGIFFEHMHRLHLWIDFDDLYVI